MKFTYAKNIISIMYKFITTNTLLKVIALTLALILYSNQYFDKKSRLKKHEIQKHQNTKRTISK